MTHMFAGGQLLSPYRYLSYSKMENKQKRSNGSKGLGCKSTAALQLNAKKKKSEQRGRERRKKWEEMWFLQLLWVISAAVVKGKSEGETVSVHTWVCERKRVRDGKGVEERRGCIGDEGNVQHSHAKLAKPSCFQNKSPQQFSRFLKKGVFAESGTHM